MTLEKALETLRSIEAAGLVKDKAEATLRALVAAGAEMPVAVLGTCRGSVELWWYDRHDMDRALAMIGEQETESEP